MKRRKAEQFRLPHERGQTPGNAEGAENVASISQALFFGSGDCPLGQIPKLVFARSRSYWFTPVRKTQSPSVLPRGWRLRFTARSNQRLRSTLPVWYESWPIACLIRRAHSRMGRCRRARHNGRPFYRGCGRCRRWGRIHRFVAARGETESGS
jgi:hypothetical protein